MSFVMEHLQATYDYFVGRKRAFQLMKSPGFRPALEHLAKFCRANDSTFHPDPRIHAGLEGRREVWLMIQQHINLPIEEQWKLYDPRPLYQRNEDDDA